MAIRREKKTKPRLGRQDWIDAAIQRLFEEGIGAVSVEQLATRLGVTRGSFYHHFADREDLLRAMLDDWAQRWTYDVRDQLAALGLDPGTTLLALMRAIRSQGASKYDAPFRAWALHDPLARAVLEQVDATRLDYIRSLFEGLGFSGLEAECRARLFLYYEAAAPAMFAGLSPGQDEELLLKRHRFLTAGHVD
jgi:AcrR family transcriptional regulator